MSTTVGQAVNSFDPGDAHRGLEFTARWLLYPACYMHTVAEDTLQLSALHTRSKMATSRTTACTQRDLQHAAHRRFCRASYTYCILCACLLVVQVPRPGACWVSWVGRDTTFSLA